VSAVEKLAEIEAEHTTDHPYCGGCPLTTLVAALRAVLALADKWEHGATRWADPLPVPLEVEQVRTAIESALDGAA
jgi:hypothetical protein